MFIPGNGGPQHRYTLNSCKGVVNSSIAQLFLGQGKSESLDLGPGHQYAPKCPNNSYLHLGKELSFGTCNSDSVRW